MTDSKFISVAILSTLFTIHCVGSERRTSLGYPPIPASVLEKSDTRGPNSVSTSLVGKTQSWALSSIGFFSVFNPLLQPVDPQTTRCSKSIVVAVIDTGIDYTHPDLTDSLWVNSGEVGPWTGPAGSTCKNLNCNGIDDDHNGYKDDVIGWDYVHEIGAPFDNIGHGTHISGIIASNGQNSVLGVCNGVSVMSLKYYDPLNPGSNNLKNLVRAIRYANENGADIINFSGGGTEPSVLEQQTLRASRELGVLLVAAAGNQGRSNELFGSFPANYPIDNIISVASVDSKNDLLSSSNFGENVHLAAPGDAILSTFPLGGSSELTGTSQATAFVSGAAALLMSQLKTHTQNDYVKIKSWLTRSAKPAKFSKEGAKVGHGLLSLPDALKLSKAEQVVAR